MMTLYIALTYMIEKFVVYEKYLGKLHQPLLKFIETTLFLS